MNGLVFRALQRFVEAGFGPETWREVAGSADDLDAPWSVEGLSASALIETLSRRTGRSPDELFEDLGTFLVARDTATPLRRLLRFGGETFVEFLYSLEDLPERAALALPELRVPQIEVRQFAAGAFSLTVGGAPGAASVLSGVLRAMADEYGALVVVRIDGAAGRGGRLLVEVADADFSAGRAFRWASA